MYIRDSNDNTLINNTCRSNDIYGIMIRYSNENTLIKNNCSSNEYYGILVYSNSGSNIMSLRTWKSKPPTGRHREFPPRSAAKSS